MTAERVAFGPGDPAGALRRCTEVIAAGGAIVYPTDTFYGLGVDPRNTAAVERLFRIKGRAAGQPVLLLLHDTADVADWAASVPPGAKRLMERYWPGPLTLVFPARPGICPLLTAGTGAIGLRVPGNDLTRTLLGEVGHALTGTSANRSGQAPACTAEAAVASLGGGVDLVLDSGPASGGLPSTVAEIRNDRIVVIRQGAIRL